jgi:DNA-binding transcriptional LysR family regulator
MELDQIRSFLVVARSGSFSLAARELYRTQPAISIKIRGLERELGQQLLERRQRGVALTPAGEVFRRRAEAILAEVDNLGSELRDLSARRLGHVSLGASDTVCLYLLPRMIRRFTQQYPGIQLRLVTQVSQRVLDLILTGQIDIGIVTLPVPTDGIETRPLYLDEFVVVLAPDHPLASRKPLRPSDLQPHPIIHLRPDTLTRRWIDAKLEPFGLRHRVRMEVSTIEVIKKLVEVGLGISLLPEMAVAEEVRAGRLRAAKLAGLPLRKPMGLAYRSGKYFSAALTAFVEGLTAHANTLRTSSRARLSTR